MRVYDLLGVSSYALLKYGVSPDDPVEEALQKLRRAGAEHIARLLESLDTCRQWKQILARHNGAEPAQAIYHYLEKCL